MKSTRRIHVTYLVTILALISLGATYAAHSLLGEVGPIATITGVAPELEFHDTTSGDADWEIEVNQGVQDFFELSIFRRQRNRWRLGSRSLWRLHQSAVVS